MARHPEVKETEIIAAAEVIEKAGKLPNPGSIRAQLGYRGGLIRIKAVWTKYTEKREKEKQSSSHYGLSVADLPSEIASDIATHNTELSERFEGLCLQIYKVSQQQLEKRIQAIEQQAEQQMEYIKQYEEEADESIQVTENELKAVKQEAADLAAQNAALIVQNAELKGELKAVREQKQKLERK